MEADDEGVAGGGDDMVLLGAARAVITPPVGCELSGFIARHGPMRGIHDDLYARALVWSTGSGSSDVTAALLTLDLIGLDRPVVETICTRVAAHTPIPAANIAVTTTHTHGGPSVMDGRLGGHADPVYMAFLIAAAAGAVIAAYESRSPATARFALGHEPHVGKNRRIPGGLIDPDVPVLRFDGPDGQARALLVSYACHPVTLGAENVRATADYPGYVVRTLELLYPAAHIQFATGCCGQVNTGHTPQDSVTGRGGGRRTYSECARLGRAIAGAALQAAEHVAPVAPAAATVAAEVATAATGSGLPAVAARRTTLELPLEPVVPASELRALADSWREEATQLRHAAAPAGDVLLRHAWAQWAEETAMQTHPCRTVTADIMVLAVGGTRLVLLPGEAFVELGLEIKRRAGWRALLVVAYANSNPGYIPHRSAYAEGGYEVNEAYRFYGYPAGFAPEAGEMLVEEALRLLDQLRSV